MLLVYAPGVAGGKMEEKRALIIKMKPKIHKEYLRRIKETGAKTDEEKVEILLQMIKDPKIKSQYIREEANKDEKNNPHSGPPLLN